MKIVKASYARQNFQEVIDTVYYKQEPTLIMKRKKPWVVIQPTSDLDPKQLEKMKKAIEKNLS